MNRKAYRRLCRKETAIRIQEMKDGCLECRRIKGLCCEHLKEAIGLTRHPKKLGLKRKP